MGAVDAARAEKCGFDRVHSEAVGGHVDVFYVPGADNRYEPDEEVVVLDSRLREYPQAHDLILNHEIEHANPNNKTRIGLAKHEFFSDLRYHFGQDDGIKQAREYVSDRSVSRSNRYVLVTQLRYLWQLAFGPLGLVHRWLCRRSPWFERMFRHSDVQEGGESA